MTEKELLPLLTGRKVIISECQGNDHTEESRGCLCRLKGTTQTVGRFYDSIFVGTPSWWLEGHNKTVRLSEITLLPEPPVAPLHERLADSAMHEIWRRFYEFYDGHFRKDGIGLSVADQRAFEEIAQPILRELAKGGLHE